MTEQACKCKNAIVHLPQTFHLSCGRRRRVSVSAGSAGRAVYRGDVIPPAWSPLNLAQLSLCWPATLSFTRLFCV